MPDINQSQNGSGDNVARDKVTNINFPFRTFILTIVLVLLSVLVYKNWNIIERSLGCDKIFDKSDTSFKVLIMPFKKMCKDAPNKDIGLEIKERLNEINKLDSLNLYPAYYEGSISDNFNSDSAKYLQKYHYADQIIYGNYVNNSCLDIDGDGDEICYNWFTDEKWDLDTLQYNFLTSSNYQKLSIKDLREGKYQGSTDYIVYWIAGLNAYNQVKYEKALKYWRHIYEKLYIKNFDLVRNICGLYIEKADTVFAPIYCNKLINLASNSQDSLEALYNLAHLKHKQGDYYTSILRYRKVKKLSEKINGKDHPYTLALNSDLAIVLSENENFNEADSILEEVVPSLERILGNDNVLTIAAKNNLATNYLDSENYIKAKPLLEAVVSFIKKNFDKDHPNTIKVKSNLAITLMNIEGELDKAKNLLNEAMFSSEKTYGTDHYITGSLYSYLAFIYYIKNDKNKGDEYYKKTKLNLKNNSLPKGHPNLNIISKSLEALKSYR